MSLIAQNRCPTEVHVARRRLNYVVENEDVSTKHTAVLFTATLLSLSNNPPPTHIEFSRTCCCQSS